MRKLAAGLALALLWWAVYIMTNTIVHPGPVTPPSPENPYAPVCPTSTATAVHPAVWPRRGAVCPEVTSTMTIGGEST